MNVTARPDGRRARWHPVLTRTRTSRALMALAAVSAAIATITDVPAVSAAPASTLVVEIWRLCGFGLFTGLFVLLAVRPHGQRGLWELVIANKLALTAAAACFVASGEIPGASSALTWDGLLAALLLVGYITARGWRSGRAGNGQLMAEPATRQVPAPM